MTRYSFKRSTEIEYQFWLTFSQNGDMRLSRGKPATAADERAMACTATLPLALFKTPQLRATISIAEGIAAEFHIDIEAASEALRGAIGCDVDLKIIPPAEPS